MWQLTQLPFEEHAVTEKITQNIGGVLIGFTLNYSANPPQRKTHCPGCISESRVQPTMVFEKVPSPRIKPVLGETLRRALGISYS